MRMVNKCFVVSNICCIWLKWVFTRLSMARLIWNDELDRAIVDAFLIEYRNGNKYDGWGQLRRALELYMPFRNWSGTNWGQSQ